MLKKFLICWLFFFLSPSIIILCLFFASFNLQGRVLGESVENIQTGVNVYASLPQSINTLASSLKTDDAVPVMIEKYLKKYNSPLYEYRDFIVSFSKQYNVNPLLIVAIAQQESNLGKTSPEDCYNAWGWGIHQNGTKCYNDWPEAIESVTRGIGQNYCDKGLCDDPCVMMKKYTPKSNGSWCFGVNHFLEEMINGNF